MKSYGLQFYREHIGFCLSHPDVIRFRCRFFEVNEMKQLFNFSSFFVSEKKRNINSWNEIIFICHIKL